MNFENVRKNFVDLKQPYSFAGLDAVYRHFKNKVGNEKEDEEEETRQHGQDAGTIPVTKPNIEKILASVDSYGLLRHRKRRPRQYNPYYLYSKLELLQWDLCDLRGLAEHNSGYSWWCLGLDCYTRKAWGRKMRRKTKTETAAALDSIMAEVQPIPGKTRIMLDYGNLSSIKYQNQ